jgi:hypothetical protein
MKVKNILLIGIAILTCIASSQAQNVNIPNAIFKEVLLGDTSINTNGDAHIQVSEASVFNGAINVSGLGITNLTGIEAFVLLDSLDCSFNAIDTLNLSANTALRYLDCSNNTYTYLCGNNDLTGLDVEWHYDDQSQNFENGSDPSDPNYGLTCFVHSSPVFNFLNNEALTYLNCSSNNLISLNVSACSSLNYLICSNNRLSSINLSDNTELTYLHCAVNYLTSLNLSDNTELTYLHCAVNYLTSLNVSACTDLTVLWCPYNQLPILNVSGLTALFDLDCSYNGLTSLNLLACTSLTYLDCFFNFLPSLNVSTNTALSYLNCVGNSLESIDLTANTALTFLNCGDNVLQSLNVSANTALTIMACAYNQLSSLNVSANTALTVLHCYNNLLTSLNVSACTELNALWCFDNLLTCLNVKNGTNLNHGYLYTYNNNLNCIEVDDIAWSADNWVSMSPEDYLDNYYQGVIYYGLIDSSASFSLNCSSAAISYSSSSFCQSDTIGQAVSQTGTSGGTYSASPSGLSINASSGTITPSASSPGTYTVNYTMAASGGCAAASVTGSLNLTITPSSTNTTNTSAVGTYTWANNGLTYTSSGVYTGTTLNCVTQVLNLTITPSSATLSLQVFLDGYYIYGSNPASMRAARYVNLTESGSANSGANTDVDVITVELRSPSNLNVVAYSVSPILQTNGSVQCVFPAGAIGASYYIVVKHRSAIPLWSGNPIIMAASSAFSFANNSVNAYSDGSITPMHALVPSLFGIWLGELNDDGFIDGVDYTVYETDTYLSQYGGLYLLDGDLNGDTYVDASDFSVFDFNASLGSYEQRP